MDRAPHDPTAPCRLLDWDSAFFGRRIARATVGRLDPDAARGILAWCARERVDCLYFLADADDPGTVRLAEAHGFRQVDIRVTLERPAGPPPPGPPPGPVRPAAPGDLPALRALARTSHRASRFYHDGGFPRERCDELYATWIERSCRGAAEAVLVADDGAGPAGYVSCHLPAGAPGAIGLFAVAAARQGGGLGRALLAAALRWFAERGAPGVTVVTQGRNVAAQRLYQRGGFLTRSLELWYHRWFP